MCSSDLVPLAIENDQLRAQVNNYFSSVLPKKPSNKDYQAAARRTIFKYPDAIDYYIKYKEENGNIAVQKSKVKVENSFELYVEQFGALIRQLEKQTKFYEIKETSKSETLKRINYLKDAIENKGCHKYFYFKNEPIRREEDLHILFRLTWYDTIFDVSREVNDGRGPADFKVSKGLDKTIAEFKLARNTQLKRNLEKQVEIYKKASDAETGFKVIIYFTEDEFKKVNRILDELDLSKDKNIVLIDARIDNKPTASKA